MAVFRRSAEGLLLQIRVTPNASTDSCAGIWRGADNEERLALRVTAPPDKGRANKAVVKLVASLFDLPKSAVRVSAGEKDRLKTLTITGDGGMLEKRLDAVLCGLKSGDGE